MTDGTLIGDLLHHRGRLIDIRQRSDRSVENRELQFAGYADLLATWPALGINVEAQDDGSLKLSSNDPAALTHDLWQVTTNLLGATSRTRVAVDLKQGETLRNPKPTETVSAIIKSTAGYSRSYFSIGSVDDFGQVPMTTVNEIVLSQRVFAQVIGAHDPIFPIHELTVGDVLTLDPFGTEDYPGQDTDAGQYVNRALTLTPFGLVLTATLEIELTRPISIPEAFFFPTRFDSFPVGTVPYMDGTKQVYRIAIRFNGYDWPNEDNPAFISPRKKRILARPVRSEVSIWAPGTGKVDAPADHHPNITSQPIGAAGLDYEIVSLSGEKMATETTEIAFLTPLPNVAGQVVESPFDFPTWPNPDPVADFLDNRFTNYGTKRANLFAGVKSGRVVRMNGLREHYNCIANFVNSLKKARSYDFFKFPFLDADGQWFTVVPNNIGPFADPEDTSNPLRTVRPRNHFATVTEGGQLWDWAIANDVPIKTVNDLPSSLKNLKTVKNVTRAVKREVRVSETFTGVTGSNYNVHIVVTDSLVNDKVVGQSGSLYEGFDSQRLQDYRWLTVEDVQEAAERLGFEFRYERCVVPFELKTFTHGHATELFKNVASLDYTRTIPTANVPSFIPPGTVIQYTDYVESNYVGKDARFVEAVEDDLADWIWDDFSNRPLYLVDHHAGDVLTVSQLVFIDELFNAAPTHSIVAIYKIEAEKRYLRDIDRINFWRPINRTDQEESKNIGVGVASILVQTFLSDGLDQSVKLILVNSDGYEHDGDSFSETDYQHAAARDQHGVSVLPIKTVSAVAEEAEEQTLDDAETFVTAEEDDSIRKVVFFQEWPLTL